MEQVICQSCGMILNKDEFFGTNSDGSKNKEYCIYCFKNGCFTVNVSMDEMIEISAKHIEELRKAKNEEFDYQIAINEMKEFFPKLKRWEGN